MRDGIRKGTRVPKWISVVVTGFAIVPNILLFQNCEMRFTKPQAAAEAAPVIAPAAPTVDKVSLLTSILSTNDPLKPYNVKVNVAAKKYDGLVLVKATEQIIIGKVGEKVTFRKPDGISEAAKEDVMYSQLSKVNQPEFEYVDSNVNAQETFWYAVIRPDESGTSGTIEDTQILPQPQRIQVPAATSDPTVALSSSVKSNGSGLKPYSVELTVSAPLGERSILKLVKASSASALTAGTYTILATINSNPFVHEDSNVYPTDTYVYGVINQGTQAYQLPAPASVQLPALNNTFASLELEQIQPLGGMPSIKLKFAQVFGTQILRRYVNGSEISSVTLANATTEYLESDVAFDKVYAFKLEQLDYYNNPAGSSALLSVNYPWPVINFTTEFSAQVNAKATIHEYEMRLQDLSTIKRILQVQSSTNGTDFSTVETWTEATNNRARVENFSAPTSKYWRIVQIDRSSNILATSPIYTLTVPLDIELSGTNTLTQNYSNIGRFKLASGARLNYGVLNFSISANTLIAENATIAAFPANQKAALDTAGRNAGNITLAFENATGSLTLDVRGEAGGDGSPGAAGTKGTNGTNGSNGTNAIWYCSGTAYAASSPLPTAGTNGTNGGNGNPGQNGQPGKSGGNAGTATIRVSNDLTNLSVNVLKTVVNGGQGGAGGAGGAGGTGGTAGIGGKLGLTKAEYTTLCAGQMAMDFDWSDTNASGDSTCRNNGIFDWRYMTPQGQTNISQGCGAKKPDGTAGANGNAGANGSAGTNGLPGSGGVLCTRSPGATADTCI